MHENRFLARFIIPGNTVLELSLITIVQPSWYESQKQYIPGKHQLIFGKARDILSESCSIPHVASNPYLPKQHGNMGEKASL